MPDEERVRTKRRKLDSIITKLHEAVPLGSESLEEEENLNEAVKENVDIDKRNEPLPGSSRRKLHRTAKQNQIDKNAHPQAKPQVTDDAIESHVTENGMEVDGEQEVCCNGEGNASNEIQAVCVPAVVKEEHVENYENSLEGLQQMLGYSISEEVVDTKEDASGKKKRLLSESSDADGHVVELPRRVECTACGRNVNPAHGTICRHPCLHALVCKKCSQYYNSGPFTRDDFGIEEQCRWCGDGGSLLCCDKCDKAFCKSCIKRNLGKSALKDIVNAPEGVEWLCFACNPKPLSKLVRACNRIMNILQTLKAQKTIFKTKKGPSLTDTPNQKERRNRLSSLTENLGMSSDGALSPNESPEKMLVPDGDEDDSEDNDSAIKQSNEKARTRAANIKHNRQNGSSKKDVVIIDDSDSVQSVKDSKGKTSKVQADHCRTKRKLEGSAESDDKKSKNRSRTSNPQNTRTRKDSSNDSDSDEEKQNTKSKPKPTRKTKSKKLVAAESSGEEDSEFDSDSDSDFVSMVKGKCKETKNDSKIQKKGKTMQAVSDSEEEESEKDGKAKRSKMTRAARKDSKKLEKGEMKKQAVPDSEEEEEIKDDEEESEKDGKRKGSKKTNVAKKDSKKQKKGKTKKAVSDSEEEDEEESKKDRKKNASRKAKEAKNDSKKGKKGKTKMQVVSDSVEEEDEEEGEDEEEKSDKDRKGKTSKKTKEAKNNNKKRKKEKIKILVVSDSEEEDEESENDRKRKLRSRKTSVSQKKTRKRPRRVTSSEDESKSSEDQSDSDVPSTRFKKKQPHKQSKKKRKVASESDDDDDDDEEIDRRKKRKARRKGKTSSSESEEDKKKTKRKGKGKGKGKKKSGKKHYIENDSDESEEEDEEVSPSKRKGRKKIRKLIEDEKLAEETKKARRLEEERRKRLLERTKNNEDDMPGESAKVSKLVLESDPSTKEPIIEVKEDLLQHLKPHQCKGIQFMYNCVIESSKSWKKEEPGGGCILAHCMGLGKTLQVVALVHTLVTHQDINMQRILIVAPLNTVLNWQVEFEKWLSVDDRLEVLILQEVGGDNWRRADMLKHWLRYGGVLIMGYSMYRNLSQCYRIKSKHQKKIFQEALVDPGPELVVCDEGHILRNDGSAISRALNSIKTKRRVVLTGTPLQNNLIEYHCMVSFVKPNLLGTRKEFTNTFVNPIQNGQCADSTVMDVQVMKQRCHVLHKMLKGCVQRRDYAVLIPFLPRKHEYVIKVRLSALQRKLYQHFLSTFVFQEGDLGKKGVSLFSDYQALMRIWTHPWCLKLEALRRPETFADTDDSMDDFVVHTDEEEEEEEESEQSTTSEEDKDQSSSESEDERRHNKHGNRGRKKVSSSDEDDSDDDSVDEVIPQSKRREAAVAHSAQSSSNKASKPTVNIGGEDITVVAINEGASTSRGKHRDKKAHSIKNSTKEEEGKTTSKSTVRQSRDSPNNDSNNNSDLETVGSTRSGTNFKDYEMEKEWYDEFLTEEDQFNVELSGKLFLLMEILADAEAVGDKVLVFSQSLVTLDLIEKVLGGGDIGGDRENWCRGCDYFRMDGSTSAAMRQRWADIFNDEDNKNARLFLISTKAGGLGINLVAANRVIVFDVSWNPSHDVQSIFRVYRFGQTKAVYVYRFIAQGTMEEKIYDRQVTKLSMSGRVVDEQQIERHFTAANLRELYTFTPDVLEEDKETETVKEAAAGNETESAKETNAEVTVVTATEKTTKSGKEMEAGKETNSGKETEAEGKDEGRNQTEDGKETNSGAAKETDATNETAERPTLPLPKDAVLADLINRLHPKWIVNYHEHDSLLQNIESEELTEEEMKAAWTAYEAEKSGQVAPASARMTDPLQEHARTQQQVVARIQMNTEMLQQIQQIRELQRMQQQQEIEERMRQVRQQREQMYQQQREALLQQHQHQQDEMRRQNQLRFIQHMTQAQPVQQLQLGPNTINVQTRLPPPAAAPHHPPPPILRFQLPPTILPAPPVGTTPSSGNPPTINLTLGPRNMGGTLSNNNPQLIRPPQNTIPE